MRTLPPQLKGHWLLGNYTQLHRDFLATLVKAGQSNEKIARLRIGPQSSFLLTDPEYIKHVWLTNAENYRNHLHSNHYIRRIFGEGLILTDGESWKRQRPVAQGALRHAQIMEMLPKIVEAIDQSVQRWKKAPGKTYNLYEEMTYLTFHVADHTILGADLSHEEISTLRSTINFLSALTVKKTTRIINVPLYIPTKENLQHQKALASLRQLVDDIRKRCTRNTRGPRLIQEVIKNKDESFTQKQDEQRICHELLALMWSSYETTSVALCWTWDLLSKHPEVARKLYEEVDQVLGKRRPSEEDLPKLNYTRAVIKESLRLYPPAWLFSRISKDEDKIGGYDIPANHVIFATPYITHRLADYWHKANHFIPERFLDQRQEKNHPFAYIPFGGGPRSCVGYHLSMTEAQLAIAMMAQHFHFSTQNNEEIPLNPEFALYQKKPIHIRVELRE